MKKNNTEIKYYCEFTSKDGHHHYAVHSYNPINGFVTSLNDYRLECGSTKSKYDLKDLRRK